MSSYITYSVSTDSDSYTRDSAHEPFVPELVRRIETEAVKWMSAHYPDVEFDTRRDGRTTYSQDDGHMSGIVEILDDYINRHWTTWFEEIVPA